MRHKSTKIIQKLTFKASVLMRSRKPSSNISRRRNLQILLSNQKIKLLKIKSRKKNKKFLPPKAPKIFLQSSLFNASWIPANIALKRWVTIMKIKATSFRTITCQIYNLRMAENIIILQSQRQ